MIWYPYEQMKTMKEPYHIVVRTVFFDQITFQHQCFNFRFADDIFKPRDVADHFFDFR